MHQKSLSISGHPISASPLALLNDAFERLPPGGLLTLDLDFESLPADAPHRTRLLGYLCALAGRCGFRAEPDCDQYDEEGRCLVRCYREERAPRWRIDLLQEGEIEGFAALFKDAFNTDISLPLWRWKYAEGRGHGVIARRGERIIAHYGCTRRRILWRDRPASALQMCDVMVDPRERGVMTKQGAMFLTTATMLELYLGLQPADLPFGFPSGRHERLGERLGLYAEVGRIAEVTWPVADTRPRLQTRARDLNPEAPETAALVERLWSAMRRDLGEAIVVVRDWDYLRYRYVEHPAHHYRLVLVSARLSGRPLGLLVLRELEDRVEWLDVVGPLKSLPLCIEQARRLAGLWGANSLFCWITRQHLDRFATPEATISDPDVSIPTNAWVEGPPVEQLKDRWWLMSGDTEFH